MVNSKDLLLKMLIYYTKAETNKSTLITLHTLMTQVPDFRSIVLDTHKLTLASFDSFVTTAVTNYQSAYQNQKWDEYQNICSSISGFIDCFPERSEDFKELIVPIIKVCSDKTEQVRKKSAVLLAKLSKDENNKKIITANHGIEVLVSLQGQLI